MKSIKTLRLILGDQLNGEHSWFKKVDPNVTYVMAEIKQETTYVTHHIQKVVAFFASMRSFAAMLKKQGHIVRYYTILDKENPQELKSLVKKLLASTNADRFEYMLPDEYRLDIQLHEITQAIKVPSRGYDTEHFYTSRHELKEFFAGKRDLLMESFYRMMRKKHDILMEDGKPLGGAWNFDHSNRKKWTGKPAIPAEKKYTKDVSVIYDEIKTSGFRTIGKINPAHFPWPTSREESLDLLQYFCTYLLPFFGDFQDALHSEQKFLFHSRLSFALNTKMIGPAEVIQAVVRHYHVHPKAIDISQVEGFVRQILGWREYMRGIYWKEMPGYQKTNALNNTNRLPEFFWTGKTKMRCLQHAISQSLEEAYAHHIQRLMITGNYALLTQTHPDEVDAWYLGIYIDAIEWVEITNTRGMSQFADGGIVATKPYVSSANYINKMSNYCKGCHYDPGKKTTEDACPFNALYWNFLDAKKEHFKKNPRMGMMLNLLEKKDTEEMNEIRQRAHYIIANPQEI